MEIQRTVKQYSGKVGDNPLCVVCGKPVTNPNPKMVRLVNGGRDLVLEAELIEMYQKDHDNTAAADMYFYPVGSECLRKHPELKPYTKPFETLIG